MFHVCQPPMAVQRNVKCVLDKHENGDAEDLQGGATVTPTAARYAEPPPGVPGDSECEQIVNDGFKPPADSTETHSSREEEHSVNVVCETQFIACVGRVGNCRRHLYFRGEGCVRFSANLHSEERWSLSAPLRENVSKLGQSGGSTVGENELNLPFKLFAIAGSRFPCRHQTEASPAAPPAITSHSPRLSHQRSFPSFVLHFRCIRSAAGAPVHLSCCAKGCD